MTNATVTSDGRRYDQHDIDDPHTDHGPSDDKEWLVCARSSARRTQTATAAPDWRDDGGM